MTQLPVNPTPPEWMSPFVQKALAFAAHAHRNQVRKYTGEPYIYHPIDVATTVYEAFQAEGTEVPEFMLCAALLHDVVEDCEVTFTELRREFNEEVAACVMFLTDLVTKEQGNRDTRKFMEATRIGYAPVAAQTVKLADLISNSRSIFEHDPDFAVVYLREKERVLNAISMSFNNVQPETLALYDQAVAIVTAQREVEKA